MDIKYPPLEGKCKSCLYKCGRVEDPSFKGVYRCEYYMKKNKKTFSKLLTKC